MTLEGVDCTRVQEIEATPAGKMEELSVAPIERISYTYKQVSLLSEDRYPRQISLRSLLPNCGNKQLTRLHPAPDVSSRLSEAAG
jgi:hypothetical protein